MPQIASLQALEEGEATQGIWGKVAEIIFPYALLLVGLFKDLRNLRPLYEQMHLMHDGIPFILFISGTILAEKAL